jgi:hypothetical protein
MVNKLLMSKGHHLHDTNRPQDKPRYGPVYSLGLCSCVPGGKNFENAPKFKSSPQNNGISTALLKQKLCVGGM